MLEGLQSPHRLRELRVGLDIGHNEMRTAVREEFRVADPLPKTPKPSKVIFFPSNGPHAFFIRSFYSKRYVIHIPRTKTLSVPDA